MKKRDGVRSLDVLCRQWQRSVSFRALRVDGSGEAVIPMMPAEYVDLSALLLEVARRMEDGRW